MNIFEPFLFQAQRQPPAPAICAPGQKIPLISYGRLLKWVNNISRRLVELELGRGSIIAVAHDETIPHIAILLSAARLGIATVTVSGSADVKMAVRYDYIIGTIDRLPKARDRAIVFDSSWLEGEGLPLPPHLIPPASDSDICRFVLTSGTTSEPKAVAITQRLLTGRINRHFYVFGSTFPECSRIYVDVPLTSSLGFQYLMYGLWRGGVIVFPGADFDNTLRAIEDYRVELLVGSPGGFELLTKWFETIPSYQSSIRSVFCGGDILSRTLSERIRSRICSNVIAAYGSTEASMSATAHAQEIYDSPRSVGFITPGVNIQILDSAGAVMPRGSEGLIRIKSNFAVTEYYENPRESEKVFRDGWFYPGDIGRIDTHGLLTITGREHAVLNLGGDKISAEFIESVLTAFPDVIQAAVIEKPNALGVNEVWAIVVSRGQRDEPALRAHCKAGMAQIFVPVRFEFAESLPRNAMGKIDRHELRKRYAA